MITNPKSSLTGLYGRDSLTIDNPMSGGYFSDQNNSNHWSSRLKCSDLVESNYQQQRRRVSGPDSYSYFCTTSEIPNSFDKTSLTTSNVPVKSQRYFKQHNNMARQAKRCYPMNPVRREERLNETSSVTNNNFNNNEYHQFGKSTSNCNLYGVVAGLYSMMPQSVTKSCSVPNFAVFVFNYITVKL